MPGLLVQGRQRWARYLWGIWASGDWHAHADEERRYALNHMVEHLDDASMPDETAFALVSEDWMRAWAEYDNSYTGFIDDVERIWRRADAANNLALQVKCALCRSGVASFGANIPMILLPLALQYRLVTPEQALGIARAKDEQEDRAETLIVITPHLPIELLSSVLDLAETLTEDYHHFHRGSVLAAVIDCAPRRLHHRILTLIGAMDARYATMAKTLSDIASQIDPGLVGEMAEIARAMSSPKYRVVALKGVALSQSESARAQLLLEAFDAAKQIKFDQHRTEELVALVEVATAELRMKFYDEALNAARTMEEVVTSFMRPADYRALALFRLLPFTPIGQREEVIEELIDSIPAMGHRNIQEDLLGRVERELESRHLTRVRELMTLRGPRPEPPRHEHEDHLRSGISPYFVLLDEVRQMSRGADPKRLAEIIESAASLRRSLNPDWSVSLLRAAAAKADEPLLTEILGKLCRSARQLGTSFGAGQRLFEVARDVLELPGDRTTDALRIVRAAADPLERAKGLTLFSALLRPALRVSILREALHAAGSANVSEARQKLLDELLPGPVDFGDVAADAIELVGVDPNELDMGAEFPDHEKDEPDDQRRGDSAPKTEPDIAAELASIRAAQAATKPGNGDIEDDEQVATIGRLAPALTGPLLEEALAIGGSIEGEHCRRMALVALLPYLPDGLWQQAADVAESISDYDESGEAWIAIAARAAGQPLARRAVERGLESIRRAQNEDDYREPFLRMAAATPDNMLPLALEVAADLYVEEDHDRRAIAFKALAWRLETWSAAEPVYARQAWPNILHRLAARPLGTFLWDFVGFNYFGRILAGPDGEQLLVEAMIEMVSDVSSWWEPSASSSDPS
jgi:hypothetical protein